MSVLGRGPLASASGSTSKAMSSAGLRAFFRIAGSWGLNTEEQMVLLGTPGRSTYFKWKSAPETTDLKRDTLERLSYILGIYKSLQILLPDTTAADAWIKKANTAPLFGGKAHWIGCLAAIRVTCWPCGSTSMWLRWWMGDRLAANHLTSSRVRLDLGHQVFFARTPFSVTAFRQWCQTSNQSHSCVLDLTHTTQDCSRDLGFFTSVRSATWLNLAMYPYTDAIFFFRAVRSAKYAAHVSQ